MISQVCIICGNDKENVKKNFATPPQKTLISSPSYHGKHVEKNLVFLPTL